MFNRRRAGDGPGPYGSRVNVPTQMRTSPWVMIRSHAWPKQDLAEFQAALENRRQHEIAANAIFMPRSAYMHPYSSPSGGPAALSQAQGAMTRFQRAAMQKHAAGVPLSRQEALACLEMRMPRQPTTADYQAMRRAQARAAGAPALTARQLPAYVVNCIPPGVLAERDALYLHPIRGAVVSQQRPLQQLRGEHVRRGMAARWRF